MSDKKENRQYGKIVKVMQILSFVFMLAMLVVCVVFMKKNNISVSNVDALTQYLTGGTLTVALIIIAFSVVKSFALIFPPAVLFVLSGIVFDDLLTAVLINAAATACSLILPYFLGRFMGAEMVDSLKGKFRAIKKLDSFAGENSFAVVFVFKAGGLMPSDLSSLIFGAMKSPSVNISLHQTSVCLCLTCCGVCLAQREICQTRSHSFMLCRHCCLQYSHRCL